MENHLTLDKMSTEEKIRTMEIIWDDLCSKSNNIPSPTWHKQILEERENGIKNGDVELVDWNNAKEHIRNSIS
jgi:hypothetical protein